MGCRTQRASARACAYTRMVLLYQDAMTDDRTNNKTVQKAHKYYNQSNNTAPLIFDRRRGKKKKTQQPAPVNESYVTKN